MVFLCSVNGCNNTSSDKSLSFFKITKNPIYRDKWLRVCKKRIVRRKENKVCSVHFLPESFKERNEAIKFVDEVLNSSSRKLLLLKPDAIPTENLMPFDEEQLQNPIQSASEVHELPVISKTTTDKLKLDNNETYLIDGDFENFREDEKVLMRSSNSILENICHVIKETDESSEISRGEILDELDRLKQVIEDEKRKLEEENIKIVSAYISKIKRIEKNCKSREVTARRECNMCKDEVIFFKNKLDQCLKEKEALEKRLHEIFTPGQVILLLGPD